MPWFALTPALSRREREKSGTHYLAVGSVISAFAFVCHRGVTLSDFTEQAIDHVLGLRSIAAAEQIQMIEYMVQIV